MPYRFSQKCNYEIIEGCRKDSIVYSSGGYTYRKDIDVKGVRYLRCTKLREGCPARTKIYLDCISIIKEHESHDVSESKIEIIKVMSRVKRKADSP